MTVEFNPESWEKSGKAFTDNGRDFGSDASAMINGFSIDKLECNNGGTLADGAFGIVFPVLFQALSETATGLSGGIKATGDGLDETAKMYRRTEESNGGKG